jgi:hypothetical protein
MSTATRQEIMAQSARQPVASQSTSIEQSRAVAEVQGALVVAQQRPRDETKALERALSSCRTKEVASVAFYKFPRGGETVQGETIQMAVELARCWGNIDYGIMELERDEVRGHTEMLAFAWDLETNTRSRQAFIVPHRRDTKSGAKPLTDMRDIYENNANNGARRLRECIFRVLPAYFKEATKSQCIATLSSGGEVALPLALADAVKAFEGLGVTRDRIEAKLGPLSKMTAIDLATLRVSHTSIKRREISADEEFPRIGHVDTAQAIRDQSIKPAETLSPDNTTASEGLTDEPQRDAFGLLPVTGEAKPDDAPADERLALAAFLIARFEAVTTRDELDSVAAEFLAETKGWPDEIYAKVKPSMTDAETRVNGNA